MAVKLERHERIVLDKGLTGVRIDAQHQVVFELRADVLDLSAEQATRARSGKLEDQVLAVEAKIAQYSRRLRRCRLKPVPSETDGTGNKSYASDFRWGP